jgi:hypothetical protein
MSAVRARARLRPLEEAFLSRALQFATQTARLHGAQLVVLTLRLPGHRSEGSLPAVRRVAADLEVPVLECSNVWKGHNPANVVVSPIDAHANAEGNRILAECVTRRLLESGLVSVALR